MGYELVEQLGWTYPDAVFYPTGGGVGLIGMWKAFEEMEQLGWVDRSKNGGQRPKMYAPAIQRLRPPSPSAYAEHKPTSRVLPERRHLCRRPPAFPSPTPTPSSSTSSAESVVAPRSPDPTTTFSRAFWSGPNT